MASPCQKIQIKGSAYSSVFISFTSTNLNNKIGCYSQLPKNSSALKASTVRKRIVV